MEHDHDLEPGRSEQEQQTRRSETEEYRRRQEMKAKRRKKRQMQRLLLLGAFLLAAVLLVVGIVLIIRAIIKPKDEAPAPPAGASSSLSEPGQLPVVETPVAPDATAWNLVLINRQNPMPEGFAPETVDVSKQGHKFDARSAESLTQMIDACNAVEGNALSIISASRGETTQNDKHNQLVAALKAQDAALDDTAAEEMANEVEPLYPYSDHQSALAVDFITGTVTGTEQAFANTAEYSWLTANAAEYGFILRFPDGKSSITGFTFQPYHWRYVGPDDAKAIQGAGICLEEYVRATGAPVAAQPPENTSGSESAASTEDSSGE